MKYVGSILLGLVFSVCSAAPSTATSLTYEYLTVAGDDGPGAGILYKLEVDTTTKAAVFTIDGSASAADVWRADWFTFKWSSSADYELTNLVAPGGIWKIADFDTNQNVKVLNGGTYSSLLEANRSGFYLTSIAQGGSGDPTAAGSVCLAPGSGSFACTVALPKVFTFSIAVPTGWNEDDIPFKVGYYDGLAVLGKRNVKFVTGKLSRELDEVFDITAVPDTGSSLGLLGLGVLALALLRRGLATL
jgi:hypothetical protein